MALWIRIIDQNVVTTTVTPSNGKTFSLEEMQRFVGGYIEAVPLGDGRIMWLNEEGKLQDLPYNPVADAIAGLAERSDFIVGNVLIASREESGEEDE